MMNPLIASLMQQAEQASKAALEDNDDFAMPMLGSLFGGLFGGGQQPGGLAGAMGGKPGMAAPPAGYGQTPWAPRQPVEVIPYTAPTPAAYNPDPPEIGFGGQPSGGGVMEYPEPTANVPVAPIAAPVTPPAPPNPIADKWGRNDPGAPPPPTAAEVAAGVLDAIPPPPTAAQVASTALNSDAPGFDAATGLTWDEPDQPFDQSLFIPDYMHGYGVEELRDAGIPVGPRGFMKAVPGGSSVEDVLSYAEGLFDPTSYGHLAEIDPRLVQLAAYARENSGVDFGISDGLRTMAEQERHLANGATTTLNSRHLRGNAFDYYPRGADGQPDWENVDAFRAVSDAVKQGAQEFGYDDLGLQWGGDWLSFVDMPHIQIDGHYLNDGFSGELYGWPFNGENPRYAWSEDMRQQPQQPQPTQAAQVQPAGDYRFTPQPDWAGYQTEFVETMLPLAMKVNEMTGLDPRLVIAQSALETGWGRSAPGNNFFGIKSHGKPGGNVLSTREVINGQNVTINDSFRAYDNPEQSALDYVDFLKTHGRYKDYLAAPDYESQLAALGASGYATDPYYTDSIDKIVREINLVPREPNVPDTGFGVFSTKAPETTGFSGALEWAGGDDWSNPYTNRNMAIFGGVGNGGNLYHGWDSGHRWAHDNDYADYSQMYREFTYEAKPGYVPVGERDGRTVYAAPAPEYVGGKPVSRDSFVEEAKRRGALVPTETEMRALYDQASPVRMPTIPNGGGPNDRISFENVPEGPWYGPKEFYRTDDSPALPWTFVDAMQNPAILAAILRNNYGG